MRNRVMVLVILAMAGGLLRRRSSPTMVRRGDLDYYINLMPKFQYDATSQTYLDTWSQDAEAAGIRIAHTLQFMAIATP